MLLEIMNIPKILEDEDIVSWFFAMAKENGWDVKSFISAFFPENIICKRDSFSVVKDYMGIFEKYSVLGFPEPEDMLMKHTEIQVAGLFMPAFYTGMLADLMLYGTDTLPYENKMKHRPFMYCPLCAREDMDNVGRMVVHIPHQVHGVTACYQHGVRLSEDANIRPEEADEQEIRLAQAVHNLYKAQVVGSLEDILGPLREIVSERRMKLPVWNIKFPIDKTLISFLANQFSDDELLRIYKKDNDWIYNGIDVLIKDAPDSSNISYEFPFISYTCGKCNTQVTQFAITIRTGGMCPICSHRTQWQAKMARRAQHCIDPEFRVVRFHGRRKVDLRHIPCGRVLEGREIRKIFLNERIVCQFCQEESREKHVGETRMMNCGLKAKITMYWSGNDVDLEFEDGSKREKIQYQHFLRGNVVPDGFYKRIHIGEKKKQKCGLECTIIRYENQFDMDVQFSDGSIRTGVLYNSFCSGILQPLGFRKKKSEERVVGKWREMKCGEKARIVSRRSYKDCDVEFEDGTMRLGVRQDVFLNGSLRPENYFEKTHMGEKRIMRNGLEGTIIRCPNAANITVRFSNGEEVNMPYYMFINGRTRLEMQKKQYIDKYVGKEFPQNCGMLAVLIEYRKANDCTVRFQNGEIRDGVQLDNLKKGKVLPPSMQEKEIIGRRFQQKCGHIAEVIEANGPKDLVIRFDNGIVRNHIRKEDLKKGIVNLMSRRDKYLQEHMYEERVMKCGSKATIVAINNAKDITIRFETGEVKEHVVYNRFKKGEVTPKKRKI